MPTLSCVSLLYTISLTLLRSVATERGGQGGDLSSPGSEGGRPPSECESGSLGDVPHPTSAPPQRDMIHMLMTLKFPGIFFFFLISLEDSNLNGLILILPRDHCPSFQLNFLGFGCGWAL